MPTLELPAEGVGDIVERPHRTSGLNSVTHPDQHSDTGGILDEPADERTLADAGLSTQRDESPMTGSGLRQAG